jgi:hypothetical protein
MSMKSTQSTQSQPFTGEMYGRNMNFGDYLQSRMGYNPQYTGELTAPMNSTQQSAINNLSNQANNQTISDYANGKYIDPMSNPYVQGQANEIKNNASQAWGQQGDQINSMFNKNGFFGGSGQQSALQDAATNLNKSTSGALANLYSTNYQNGIGNMLNAQGAQQSAANAALNAGNTAYNVADTADTRNYAEFMRQLGFDQQNIGNYQNWLANSRNGSSTTTSDDGGAGAGSAAGTLGAAAITKCFVAGTEISTPNGEKNIEDIEVGDEVYSLDDDGNICVESVEWIQEPTISGDDYVNVLTCEQMVQTTSTQEFLSDYGYVSPCELIGCSVITIDGERVVLAVEPNNKKELVYDISTTGRNLYFANGFAVEGGPGNE